MTKKVKFILDELTELYPGAGPGLDFTNPYETVIATILSAQCTDRQVNKVTPVLFSKYPTAADLAAAEVSQVYEIVKSTGFKKKAENIVGAAKMIMLEYGGQVPSDMKLLTRLPGVGQKTANVVISCAFGGDAIAVDTHVQRVSNRLGLANSKNVAVTEEQLKKALPKKMWSKAHHLLITHGRQVCHARGPACHSCTLCVQCSFFAAEQKATGKKEKTDKAPSL